VPTGLSVSNIMSAFELQHQKAIVCPNVTSSQASSSSLFSLTYGKDSEWKIQQKRIIRLV
jgi:hypothetical protein